LITALVIPISFGAAMVILPRFDVETVLKHIRRYQSTLFPGVPRMYLALNNFPGVRKYGVSSINACLSGSEALPVRYRRNLKSLRAGVSLRDMA